MEAQSEKTFFSYARADSEFVLRLATELRSAGANLWLDQLDISAGDRWDGAVESALKRCHSLVVVLSPQAIASHNVLDEISFALEKNKRVIPIIYRPCDVPFRLRRLQHIDFTVNYRTALTGLLAALNVVHDGTPLESTPETRDKEQSDRSDDQPDSVETSEVVSHGQRPARQVAALGIVAALLIVVGVKMVSDYIGDGMAMLREYGSTMLTSETMLFVYLGILLMVVGAGIGVLFVAGLLSPRRGA